RHRSSRPLQSRLDAHGRHSVSPITGGPPSGSGRSGAAPPEPDGPGNTLTLPAEPGGSATMASAYCSSHALSVAPPTASSDSNSVREVGPTQVTRVDPDTSVRRRREASHRRRKTMDAAV